jgi:hypothetical protein
MKQQRRKIMVKITSFRWAEKDDPMFTGRFQVHSVRDKDSGQKKKKKDKINIKKYGNENAKKKI